MKLGADQSMEPINAAGTRTLISAIGGFIRLVSILAWVFFGIALVILLIGLAASTLGGALDLPFLTVVAEDVPPAVLLVGLINLLVLVPGIILICGQLSRITKTLVDGDPFVPENAPRLSRIAIILAAMEVARHAIQFAAMAFDIGEPKGVSINIAAWSAVVALFVLSHVFAEGTRLREEEKMTI